MKITNIRTVKINFPHEPRLAEPRRVGWAKDAEVANPMSGYAKFKRHRSLWVPKWEELWCKVTLEDGTWGLGATSHASPVAPIINEHLSQHLVGEDIFASQKIYDMLTSMTKPYGSTGLAAYAISAVDLACWDAHGKLLGKPVYALLGGLQKEKIFCYATGNDVDWYYELGFRAFKLACPYGPADGLAGIDRNEAFVAKAREIIGESCELMLDCWMAFDVDYTVRLAERLKPYRLKWMEECLIPEDFDGHLELRRRLPSQTLATGEHWYGIHPFLWAANHRAVDIVQPDIQWCGGASACQKIASIVEGAGQKMILHAGGNTVFGQHFSFASSSVPWCEFFVRSEPGIPLEHGWRYPGQPLPVEGWITPNDAPGFGLEIPTEWILG